MAQGINIKGEFQGQVIITALLAINNNLARMNVHLQKQSSLTRQLVAGHKSAAGAATGHASSLKGLALRFVGYNLILGQVMGAQQKLVEFVKESVENFREFETRLAEVSTILGEDVDQMHRFKAGIEGLATTYGQATSDISKGLYDILSAAFSSRDAMNLLNTSIKASIAGLSDVRTSVKIFTTVLNSYGKSVEQATHVSDVLFQSVVRGKFQFEDLESSLGFVVPIAAQAGIAFDELSAALSTATRHGLHIDMTARGLALAIQGIVNPSEQAKNAAQEYGVQMDGLSLRVLGLKGWFDQLGVAMEKHGKSILGELIPNMRSLRVAMVLAGEEGALGFAEDLRYLDNVAGATEVALTKMMNTSTVVAKKIEQEMEQVSRDVGAQWDDMILGMQSGIVTLARDWTSFLPVVGSIFTAMKVPAMLEKKHWQEASASLYRYIDGRTHLQHNLVNYLSLKKEEADLSRLIDEKMGRGEDYTKEYESLQYLVSLEPNLEKVWNTFIGGIKDTQDELARLEINLDEIIIDVGRLEEELSRPITVGWGNLEKTLGGTLGLELAQLEMAQKLKDSQHDVKMGLISSTYGWKTNNAELKEAVDIVREHEDAQKADTQATQQMTIAMRLLQIQMLEIQLAGMMRRRGLTRNEEKKMKALQIEQAKLRLENMKATKNETVEMHSNYNEKKQFIAEFLAALEEESYQLHYKYDDDIAQLKTTISSEKELLAQRLTEREMTNQAIFDDAASLILDLNALPSPVAAFLKQEQGIDVDETVKAAIERRATAKEERGKYDPSWKPEKETTIEPTLMGETEPSWETYFPANKWEDDKKTVNKIIKVESAPWELGRGFLHEYTSSSGGKQKAPPGTYWYGDIVNFKRGIESVPYDMPAMLHRDEKVVPAGRDTDNGGTIIQQVVINVKEIADIDSVSKMGAALGATRQTGVTDRMGRTKYRL